MGSFILPSSRLTTDLALENGRDGSDTLDYAEDQEDDEEEQEEEDADEWHSDEGGHVQMTEKVRRALHVDDSEDGDQEEQDDGSDSHHDEPHQQEEEAQESKAGNINDDGSAIKTNGQSEKWNRGKAEGHASSDSSAQDHKSAGKKPALFFFVPGRAKWMHVTVV